MMKIWFDVMISVQKVIMVFFSKIEIWYIRIFPGQSPLLDNGHPEWVAPALAWAWFSCYIQMIFMGCRKTSSQ
jgi:hypothetical protein